MIKCAPKLDKHYWAAIMVASIFGANVGDYLAESLNLGHLNGIPALAAVFLVLIVVESITKRPTALFYWAIIITVRAAATNIGDSLHDFGLPFSVSIPLALVLMQISITAWTLTQPRATGDNTIPVNSFYWATMFMAGVLGTLFGDYCSFGLRLGPLLAALLLGAALLFMLFIGRRGLLNELAYFWLTIAMVRSAGTAAGDYLAHEMGMGVSTAVTGMAFVVVVFALYVFNKQHVFILERAKMTNASA